MAISVAFEGPEGVGKTAQVKVLYEVLDKVLHRPVLMVREPGGTLPGEAIRNILRDGEFKDMHPRTNVLLFSASRNELIHKRILPWLAENPEGVALSDRCWWSTIAHQSTDGEDEKYIRAVQEPFIDLWPNKFIFTDLHPLESGIRMERAKLMGERRQWWRDYVDADTYAKIRYSYLSIVAEYRQRTLLLDGFNEPAVRAYDALVYILGEKPFEFTQEARKQMMKYWEEATGINYLEMLDFEGRVRRSLGLPAKEALQAVMHSDWRSLGLEGVGGRVEIR